MSGYTKLDSEILTSTIWGESMGVRLTWITMLALTDKNGEVHGSIPGLARLAGVPEDDCREGIAKFLSSDPDSRSKENAGRRIAEIDGGWLLLNYAKYREKYSREWKKERDAERIKSKREREATERDMSRTVALSMSKQISDLRSQISEAEEASFTASTPSAKIPDHRIIPDDTRSEAAGSPLEGLDESDQLALLARPAKAEGEEGAQLPANAPPPPKPKRKDADSPSGRLFAYWRDEVWPQIGETAYVESKADFVQLARALTKLSEADVRKALARVPEDDFWRGQPLAVVCSKALNKLLARPNRNGKGALPVGDFSGDDDRGYTGAINFQTGEYLDADDPCNAEWKARQEARRATQ